MQFLPGSLATLTLRVLGHQVGRLAILRPPCWSDHGSCPSLQLRLSPALGQPSPGTRHGSKDAIMNVDPPVELFQSPSVQVTPDSHKTPANALDIAEQGRLPSVPFPNS